MLFSKRREKNNKNRGDEIVTTRVKYRFDVQETISVNESSVKSIEDRVKCVSAVNTASESRESFTRVEICPAAFYFGVNFVVNRSQNHQVTSKIRSGCKRERGTFSVREIYRLSIL